MRQEYHDRPYWVIKEPVGLLYYRLEEEEWSLLELLDGRRSLEDLQGVFESRFAPQKIGLAELSHVLADLHRKGLVYSTSTGQGPQLFQRQRERRRREWLSRLSNPLAIRFRGLQPQRLFDSVYPLVRWMFSPWAIAASVLLMLMTATLVIVEFDEFRAKLPAFNQFFTFETALYLAAVMGVTKVLHELGHGLTCRHFGREVPDLGLMFLVFVPCLYCNVSDAWLLKSKWQRIAIGAAGIYVELVLASVATLVWWFSVPGVIHHIALSTMVVCSVTTLAFNANPLLRYDGYYIASDLFEIPNLSQKAARVIHRLLSQALLGVEPSHDPFLPRRHWFWFGLYAVASATYRWTVTVSILWFVYEYLKPYRLQVIAEGLAAASIAGIIGQPAWSVVRFFRIPGRRQEIKHKRLKLSLAVVTVVMALACVVPLPQRVYGTLDISPLDPHNVYVKVPGELVELRVRPGAKVEAGTTLARLENSELNLSIARLAAERDRFRAELASLRHRRFQDPIAADQVPEIEKTLAAYEKQLTQKLADRQSLTLVATRRGTVLPAPDQAKQPLAESELPTWFGNPFEPRNANCHLVDGTLFCRVGDPDRYEAVVILDQHDLGLVAVGQEVEVQLDTLPHQRLRGQVAEISKLDVKLSPKHLSNKAGGELATRTDETGRERPLSVSYQVRVPLEAAGHELRTALRGRAKIHVAPEAAAPRLWRWFCQTFHFRL